MVCIASHQRALSCRGARSARRGRGSALEEAAVRLYILITATRLKKFRPYCAQCSMATSSTLTSGAPAGAPRFRTARMDSQASTAHMPSFSRTWSAPVPKLSSPHTEHLPARAVANNPPFQDPWECACPPRRAAAGPGGAGRCGLPGRALSQAARAGHCRRQRAHSILCVKGLQGDMASSAHGGRVGVRGEGAGRARVHEVAEELPAGGHLEEGQALRGRHAVQRAAGRHAARHALRAPRRALGPAACSGIPEPEVENLNK